MRPTVRDIAERAGVSLATVDRVLNRRPGVRQKTVARVEEAVAHLGYVRDLSAANLAKRRLYPMVFVLPEGANQFMRSLEAAVTAASLHQAIERTQISCVTVPAFDEAALARTLDDLDVDGLAGVALVATDSPDVRASVERLTRAGVCVVTLVSDLPNSARHRYVGIDNVAAGRTAGGLLGRFLGGREGKVAVIAGSMLVRDHVERRMGFEQVMRRDYSSFPVIATLEGFDEGAVVARLLDECLSANPDIVGIYSLGAGNRGLIDCLEKRKLAGRVRVVAHELTAHSRSALKSGTFDAVINQDAGHEVRSAIRIIKAHADGRNPVEDQDRIRIDIFVRDNLP